MGKKKWGKIEDIFLTKIVTNKQTYIHTYIQTNIHTNKQTNKQINKQKPQKDDMGIPVERRGPMLSKSKEEKWKLINLHQAAANEGKVCSSHSTRPLPFPLLSFLFPRLPRNIVNFPPKGRNMHDKASVFWEREKKN